MKKLLSILLSLLMVLSVIPFTMMSASADGVVAYQTIVDMSDYDGANINVYSSYTKGLTRSYNVGCSYDAELEAMKLTRGVYDPCGLYYFDDSLGTKFSDSLGFRVWVKGDAASGADVTSNSNIYYLFDTINEDGTHTAYAASWYSNSSYKHVIPAEGGWLEFRWETAGKSYGKQAGLTVNRPGLQTNGTTGYVPSQWLDKVDGFAIGFGEAGAGKIYYVGDFQLIKPAVTVNVDGQDIVSISGEKITLPAPTTEGVIAYSDGEKLYYPGEEYVVPGDITLTNIKTIIGEDDEHDFVFDTTDKAYTGSEICPTVTSATLVEGEDYVVSYENNVNVGTGTVKVLGIGNCFIDVSANFNIIPKTIEVSDFDIAADGLVYTGEEIKPVVTSDVFNEDDYTVTYFDNVNAGNNAKLLIEATADKNGYGTIEVPFEILQKPIADSDFEFDLENKVFEDKEICPEVKSELGFSTDYMVGYSNNINVGTANIFVEGIGNYTGKIEKTFNIVPKAIDESMFTVDVSDKVYKNEEICPEVTSTLGEDDYKVEYADNIDAGTGHVFVTGIGNYAETLDYEFTIKTKELVADDFVVDTEDKHYTGLDFEDLVTSENLKDGDYSVAYENNKYPGTATITITGANNCTGELTYTFNILKKVITKEEFTVDVSDKEYTSYEIKPEVVTDLSGDDYQVVYSNNTNVGTATITITGVGSNCEGEVKYEFNVVQKEITEDDFSLSNSEFIYKGEEFTPEVLTIFGEENYTVEYADNLDAGTATVTITGKNNLKGTLDIEFTIDTAPIVSRAADFEYEYLDVIYTGEELCPVITAKGLVEGEDFVVEYKDNIDVGTATATIKGIGNYSDEFIYNFHIGEKEIKTDDFVVDVADKVYTGKALETEIKTELTDDDFKVEYNDNVNVGTATITITGKGNYKGVLTYNFAITPKAITNDDFKVDVADKVYTGEGILPAISTVLVADKDYTVICENNLNAGKVYVVIAGVGNYTGSLEYNFNITPKMITDADFTVDTTAKTFTGKEITIDIKSKLVKDVDYKVEYENNVNAGTGVAYITGIGNYQGQTFFEFQIAKKAITDADFTVDTSVKYYDGTAKEVEIKSDLVLNKDYVVVYSNNVEMGQAMVSITGVGNYQGNLLKSFMIEEFICDHSTIYVIGKVDATYFKAGYTGDKKCGICGGLLEQGSQIKKLKLQKPKFTAKQKGNKIKVSYKKVKGATGFQVRYRIKGKWKVKNFNAKKNATKFLKNLKKGTYKVQVRAFVKQGKAKAYSAWGKTAKVKMK